MNVKNLAVIGNDVSQIDFDKLEVIFKELDKLNNLNLDFVLVGQLSLMLLSNTVHRMPGDIDILVSFEDFDKWWHGLENEWEWYGDVRYLDFLKNFLSKDSTLKSFATSDLKYGTDQENLGTLYQINNGIKIYKTYSTEPRIKTSNLDQDFVTQNFKPLWAYHNPNDKNNIEYDKNFFKLKFHTHSVGQHFRSYVIFYDQNLKYKKIVECSFENDLTIDDEIHAIWSTPFLNFEEFNNTFYRFFIHKNQYPVRFKHQNQDIIIDCYFSKNNLSFLFGDTPCQYARELQEKSYILKNFNNKNIKLSNPYFSLGNKYGRDKDSNDFEIYGNLLQKYPLT